MQLLQHFKELTLRPKNAQELKSLILQLAIQGKLTAKWREENPNVESISELYKQIQEEKEELIKHGKIKKEKNLPKLDQDTTPYKIPSKWNWFRLVELSSINGGFAFKSSNYVEEGVRVIRISDFDENGFKNHKVVRHEYSESLESYVLEDKNILIAMTGGTVGKSLFVDEVPEVMVVNQRVATIKIFKPIYEAYINCVIPTKLIQDVIEEAKNSTNDNISMSDIKGFKIPLPPLEEQKEIVKVVETLFKEVAQLEQLTVERISLKEDFVVSALNQLTTNNTQQEWSYLQEHFKAFFNEKGNIKKLRETILQLAVQGKLTADWRLSHPTLVEGQYHASQLLKRIQKEKLQLIKEKKIKKEKALPKITEDEIPYELPDGWVFTRLGIYTHNFGQKTPNKNFEYIDVASIDNHLGIIKCDLNLLTPEEAPSRARKIVKKGCVIYSTVRPYLLNIACVDRDFENEAIASTAFSILNPFLDCSPSYLYYLLRSTYFVQYVETFSKGVAYPAINDKNLLAAPIPIPPLEEQKAIVQKVNALMECCDALEQEVQQSQQHSEQLMQSVLREVFEGEKAVEV
jgi:type I restriction enzyme S subunit